MIMCALLQSDLNKKKNRSRDHLAMVWLRHIFIPSIRMLCDCYLEGVRD